MLTVAWKRVPNKSPTTSKINLTNYYLINDLAMIKFKTSFLSIGVKFLCEMFEIKTFFLVFDT